MKLEKRKKLVIEILLISYFNINLFLKNLSEIIILFILIDIISKTVLILSMVIYKYKKLK